MLEETHVFVAKVFFAYPSKFMFIDGGGINDVSGTVFEAEKVRLSEKLWFHRSCFTCKACHGFLDVLRCTDSDGD